jgi:ACS family hexuronate transporter-like MFS transporter
MSDAPRPPEGTLSGRPPIRGLRWWICGLLFFATTVNYLDRSALAGLKTTLLDEFKMDNDDFAYIVIFFQISYAVGQMLAGRAIDWVGTRVGYLVAFLWWSFASMAHALATGKLSFAIYRFILGAGEAGNFPAAIKAVSEWFPKKERALATGILNVGAGVGAMIAPWLIYLIADPAMMDLGWKGAFVGTGAVGLVWVFFWLWLYHKPREHPRLSFRELDHIEAGQLRAAPAAAGAAEHISWFSLFKYPQVWGMIATRFFSDPIWWFWINWFFGYLQDVRGFSLKDLAIVGWIPFLASDFGSLAGGVLSTYFAHRCRSVLTARKLALACCAAVMPLSIWAGLTDHALLAVALVSATALAHQAWSASALTLPADLFPSKYVGAVYGITAMAGGLAGIGFTWVVGQLTKGKRMDPEAYLPLFIAAGLSYLVGWALFCLLARKPVVEEATETSSGTPA